VAAGEPPPVLLVVVFVSLNADWSVEPPPWNFFRE
jgi:hypothetical protein